MVRTGVDVPVLGMEVEEQDVMSGKPAVPASGLPLILDGKVHGGLGDEHDLRGRPPAAAGDRRALEPGIGPVAVIKDIKFVDSLPKTRSGKIMRRVLKAQELGQDVGDTSAMVK